MEERDGKTEGREEGQRGRGSSRNEPPFNIPESAPILFTLRFL